MPAKGSRKLNDHIVQQKILKVVRHTGRYDVAAQAVGVSERTIRRYREHHSDFDVRCHQAKDYHKIQSALKYGADLRIRAYNELLRRIKQRSISDAALIRILYASGYDNPVV